MQIYAISCLANGKWYIGQHSGKDLDKYLRRKFMYARKGYSGSPALFRALLKYGESQFVIRQIESCDSKAQMDLAERFYIKLFGTQNREIGYNLTEGGDGTLGAVMPDSAKSKISLYRTGKKASPVTKARMSLARKGKPVHSEASKIKISTAQKGKILSEGHKAKLLIANALRWERWRASNAAC